MTKTGGLSRPNPRALLSIAAFVMLLAGLMLFKLGSLTHGVSAGEVKAAATPVGWHGIYHDSFYLLLKLIRSVLFFAFKSHGQTVSRLPNVILGVFTVMTFGIVIKLWHSTRTALLTGMLFATSAWVLHASRLVSFDVVYLWAMPTLLLTNALFYRYNQKGWAWYLSLVLTGLMLYVPGMIWLILINVYLLRKKFASAWRHFTDIRQRTLYLLAGFVWLPLLAVNLTRHGSLINWLGLPSHLATPSLLFKHFLAVPVHLFVRGPAYPDIWLGRSPILDIFTLVVCLVGIQFYATHLKANRSQLLIGLAAIGWILVGLAGPVGLSLLVPLLYVVAATGIAYLLHEWMHVFPVNPLARGLGYSLMGVAIALACVYNLRAYYIAWPHNPTTRAIFQYKI